MLSVLCGYIVSFAIVGHSWAKSANKITLNVAQSWLFGEGFEAAFRAVNLIVSFTSCDIFREAQINDNKAKYLSRLIRHNHLIGYCIL
jgi:hypothetical protein